VRVLLTGGHRNDIIQARPPLEGLRPQHVLADKGYESREPVEAIEAQTAEAVIPPRSCQRPRIYDEVKYRLHNRV